MSHLKNKLFPGENILRVWLSRRRGIPLGAGILMTLACSLPCSAQIRASEPMTIENGKLANLSATGVVLQSGKKELKLSARTTYLFHTLQDKRLATKEVRLFGTMKADGTFDVDHFFTVHDGKLFRVRYYCEVCNIEALEPGRCVCCQQPTELQEIPVTDTN